MAQVEFHSNLDAVLNGSQEAIERAAEIIGGMAESYAKELCPVDTGNLRNSITHTTENNNRTVVISSSVTYAPFIELGTGKYAEGGGGRQTPWSYQDSNGNWHTTSGMPPRPYLRPAIENHKDEYKEVLEAEMSGS